MILFISLLLILAPSSGLKELTYFKSVALHLKVNFTINLVHKRGNFKL